MIVDDENVHGGLWRRYLRKLWRRYLRKIGVMIVRNRYRVMTELAYRGRFLQLLTLRAPAPALLSVRHGSAPVRYVRFRGGVNPPKEPIRNLPRWWP